MRLKKLSELIHSSKNYPDLSHASVSVHFAEIYIKNETTDEEDYQLVPKSEFVVTRTVTRNSNSVYKLNEKKSSFAEVTKLLMSKGIDLDNNRFLILQGEVEQISLMKPKAPSENEEGLLEYIEDIIGTNKYVEKIEKSLVLVEELNDQRQEKMNRANRARKEKESLEGPMKEAVNFLKKKRHLVEKKHTLIQKHLVDASLRLDNKKKEHETKEKQYNEEKEKLQTVQQQIGSKEEEFKNAKKEAETVSKQLQKVNKKFSDLENQDQQLKEEVKLEKTRKQNLEKSIKTASTKKEEILSQIQELENDENNTNEEIVSLAPELEKATQVCEELYSECKKEIADLSKQKETKQKELAPFKQKENKINEDISVKQSTIELLTSKRNSSKTDLERKKQEIEKVKAELTTKKQQREGEERVQKSIFDKIKEKEEQLAQTNSGLQESEQQVRTLRQRFHTLKTDQQNSASQNKVVKALVNNSNIPGVCGRLGDLGTIDQKYDLAASANGLLNGIVVETTESATKCVDYLKKSNIGIATFIIMDVIKKPQNPGPLPEGTQLLVDLITTDEKFKLAFHFAFQNTIVAQDLDKATVASKYNQKRWRVVTLNGEVIEDSGTLSGGGGAKSTARGLMTFTGGLKKMVRITEEEVEEAEQSLQKAETELGATLQNRSSLTQQISNLRIASKKSDTSIREIDLDTKSLSNTISDLEKQVKDIQDQMKTEDLSKYEQEIESLNEELEELEKRLEKHKKQYEDIDKEIKEITKQIDNAGGGKLKKQNETVRQLTKQLDEAQDKVSKIQVQKESKQKQLAKLEKQTTSDIKEAEMIVKKIETLEEQRKQLEDQGVTLNDEISRLKEELKGKEDVLKHKESEFEAVKLEIKTVREKELELKNTLEDISKELRDTERLFTRKKEEIEKIEKSFDEDFAVLIEMEDLIEREKRGNEDNMDTSEDEITNAEEVSFNPIGKSLSKKLKRKTDLELSEIGFDTLNYDITVIESELEKMKPNMSAIDEFKKKEDDYQMKNKEFETVTQSRNKAQKEYEDLRKRRLDEFMKGFTNITMKLKEIYQTITLGGDAELELVDSLDPFSEGIVFSVRPPKKSWKNISNLSGGEKTLSSLALVFALHYYKPTPIYVMDEIDAALDFRNVSIVANYVKERTRNDAQFIIISLRNNMFELANTLVGIYKTNDVTKSITINPTLMSIPANNNNNNN